MPGPGKHRTRHLELAWHGWEQDEGSGSGHSHGARAELAREGRGAASFAACAAVHVCAWAAACPDCAFLSPS